MVVDGYLGREVDQSHFRRVVRESEPSVAGIEFRRDSLSEWTDLCFNDYCRTHGYMAPTHNHLVGLLFQIEVKRFKWLMTNLDRRLTRDADRGG